MKTFTLISKIDIENSLKNTTRQYLVGNLKKPQEVLHIFDKRLEVGITSYDDAVSEAAHKHSEATEYQLMLSGNAEYYDINTGKVFAFSEGDFYAIAPNTAYAQKSVRGTRILFIKVPSINDKENVLVGEEIEKWLKKKIEIKTESNLSIDRQKHIATVAELMRSKTQALSWSEDKSAEMYLLGFLHDTGYAFADNQSEHAKRGGETLEKSGYKYWREVYYHGMPNSPYRSQELDLLNTCDMLVDYSGKIVTVQERLDGIKIRYGEESQQYKAAIALAAELF